MTHRGAFEEADDFVIGKIYALENDTVRQLFEEYRQAFERMRRSLDSIWDRFVEGDTWSSEDAFFRMRTEALMAQLQAEMRVLTQTSEFLSLNAAEDAWRAGAFGRSYVLDHLVQMSIMPLLPSEAIRAQILQPFEGSTFVDRFLDNELEFERRVRSALVQSQIEGEGIRKAQQRIADSLGINLRDRTSASRRGHQTNFNRTQVLARTEILKASNAGALATYRANADVLRGYQWLTAMDERVCPICAPLDQRIFNFQGQPIDGKGAASHSIPPAHPQGRCTITPVLIDERLERAVAGTRQPFLEWASERGITRNVYGQAFDLKGAPAPRLKLA